MPHFKSPPSAWALLGWIFAIFWSEQQLMDVEPVNPVWIPKSLCTSKFVKFTMELTKNDHKDTAFWTFPFTNWACHGFHWLRVDSLQVSVEGGSPHRRCPRGTAHRKERSTKGLGRKDEARAAESPGWGQVPTGKKHPTSYNLGLLYTVPGFWLTKIRCLKLGVSLNSWLCEWGQLIQWMINLFLWGGGVIATFSDKTYMTPIDLYISGFPEIWVSHKSSILNALW